MYGYIFLMNGSRLEIYGYVLDTYWIPMDISFGYIWISFGYGLDMFRIYSQAEARPCASPPAGECPAVRAAARGWAGKGGASGQASQPVTVQVHQAIVTGVDTSIRCLRARRIHP